MEPPNHAEHPQLRSIPVEHRDSDGNLTFPRSVINSTYHRLYSDVPRDADLSAWVLTGYHPADLLLIERKIYEIRRFAFHGWRRRGQIDIEVQAWRAHEEDWFAAMNGIDLEVRPHDRPRFRRIGDEYRTNDATFEQKLVTITGRDAMDA